MRVLLIILSYPYHSENPFEFQRIMPCPPSLLPFLDNSSFLDKLLFPAKALAPFLLPLPVPLDDTAYRLCSIE